MSILITPEWPYCSYPLIVEPYNRCFFNCLYCFTNHKESWHNKAALRKKRAFDKNKDIVDIDIFRKIFNGYEKLNKKEQEWKIFLNSRLAIQIGAQTEPAGNLELKYHQTKTLLEILKFEGNKYPVRISIKGIAFQGDEYIKIFRNYETASVLITIISLDEKVIKKIEPGAPSVNERLELGRLLSRNGVKLGLRLRPIIPNVTENTIEELFHKAKQFGFRWVTVEWLRIPRTMTRETRDNFTKLSDVAGIDLFDFYHKYSDIRDNRNGYLRLKYSATKKLYDKIILLGEKYHLNIASCNKDYRCMNTYTPNCCGLPLNELNWNKMQFSYAVYLARERGEVSLRDFLINDSPLFHIKNNDNDSKKYRALSYGTSLIEIWNNPKHRFYPAKFFPELKFSRKDSQGNHIFNYNDARSK